MNESMPPRNASGFETSVVMSAHFLNARSGRILLRPDPLLRLVGVFALFLRTELDELHYLLDGIRVGPVLGAPDLQGHDAVLVYDEGLRDARGLVGLLYLALPVVKDGKGDAVLLGEGRYLLRGVLVNAHRHYLEREVAEVLVERLHGGHLLLAGLAPGGPEVEEDHLALELGELARVALQVRELEVYHLGVGGHRLALLPRPGDYEDDGCHDHDDYARYGCLWQAFFVILVYHSAHSDSLNPVVGQIYA